MTIDELAAIIAPLKSEVLNAVVETLRGSEKKIGVMDERLKQAGLREETLKKELAELKASATASARSAQKEVEALAERNVQLAKKIEEMESHPDVRKAKREALEKKAAALKAELDKLGE